MLALYNEPIYEVNLFISTLEVTHSHIVTHTLLLASKKLSVRISKKKFHSRAVL